jgi:hypothetical protein
MKEELKSQLNIPATLSLGKVLPVPTGVMGNSRERQVTHFPASPHTIYEKIVHLSYLATHGWSVGWVGQPLNYGHSSRSISVHIQC